MFTFFIGLLVFLGCGGAILYYGYQGYQATLRRGAAGAEAARQVVARRTLDYVSSLDDILACLPHIQEVDEVMDGLTPDQINKLGIPMGVEFQKMMVQLSAQEGEAIEKLREITLRFTLYVQRYKLSAMVYPAVQVEVGEAFLRVQRNAVKYENELTHRLARTQFARAQFYLTEKMVHDVCEGNVPPPPQLVEEYLSPLIGPGEETAAVPVLRVDASEDDEEDIFDALFAETPDGTEDPGDNDLAGWRKWAEEVSGFGSNGNQSKGSN